MRARGNPPTRGRIQRRRVRGTPGPRGRPGCRSISIGRAAMGSPCSAPLHPVTDMTVPRALFPVNDTLPIVGSAQQSDRAYTPSICPLDPMGSASCPPKRRNQFRPTWPSCQGRHPPRLRGQLKPGSTARAAPGGSRGGSPSVGVDRLGPANLRLHDGHRTEPAEAMALQDPLEAIVRTRDDGLIAGHGIFAPSAIRSGRRMRTSKTSDCRSPYRLPSLDDEDAPVLCDGHGIAYTH